MTETREIEMVTGTVDSIVAKAGGKWQAVVKTPESGNYGKKLWTKSEDVNAAVTALLGQVATFECGVSHWTTDEGKPVTSLWINSVNPGSPPPQEPPGASEAVQAVAQEATGATETPQKPLGGVQLPPPSRDSFGDPTRASIERQVALKCAVQFCENATVEVKDVLAIAEQFDQFLARTAPF